MEPERRYREQLVNHLEGGLAFMPIESFIDSTPFHKIGIKPAGLPYSFYEIFYHIVFAQKDILLYISSQHYKAPNWPEDYWPGKSVADDEDEWEELKAGYFEDRNLLMDHILDKNNQLDLPVKNSEDHSLLREILLVIEHTAYHTGQLLMIQRLLGIYDN